MTPKPKPDDEPDAIDIEQDSGTQPASPSRRTRTTSQPRTPVVTSTTSAPTRTKPSLTLKGDQQLRVSLHFVRRTVLSTAPLATEVQKPASALEAPCRLGRQSIPLSRQSSVRDAMIMA